MAAALLWVAGACRRRWRAWACRGGWAGRTALCARCAGAGGCVSWRWAMCSSSLTRSVVGALGQRAAGAPLPSQRQWKGQECLTNVVVMQADAEDSPELLMGHTYDVLEKDLPCFERFKCVKFSCRPCAAQRCESWWERRR